MNERRIKIWKMISATQPPRPIRLSPPPSLTFCLQAGKNICVISLKRFLLLLFARLNVKSQWAFRKSINWSTVKTTKAFKNLSAGEKEQQQFVALKLCQEQSKSFVCFFFSFARRDARRTVKYEILAEATWRPSEASLSDAVTRIDKKDYERSVLSAWKWQDPARLSPSISCLRLESV